MERSGFRKDPNGFGNVFNGFGKDLVRIVLYLIMSGFNAVKRTIPRVKVDRACLFVCDIQVSHKIFINEK